MIEPPSPEFEGKLTETKAIKLSLDLWSWLAETGENKPNNFIDKFDHGCPLCTYTYLTIDDHDDDYCSFDCPLSNKELSNNVFGVFCHPTFKKWVNTTLTRYRKQYASEIRDILQISYDKIK